MFRQLNLEIKSNKWSDLLIESANTIGVNIVPFQATNMRLHALELLKWNRVINLTSIIDPVEIIVKHFLDSIAVVPFINNKCRVLDIGTGAGFPGIPLKVTVPSIFLTMVDSSRKKNSFLKHILRTLALDNTFLIHARCEDVLEIESYKKSFDLIICRAFTSLANFIKIAIPFLSKDGMIIALKGRFNKTEFSSAGIEIGRSFVFDDDLFEVRNYSYQLPLLNLTRNIIFITKKQ